MHCCCWCTAAADALLLLLHCCCTAAADALLLLMHRCCWCTAAADALLLHVWVKFWATLRRHNWGGTFDWGGTFEALRRHIWVESEYVWGACLRILHTTKCLARQINLIVRKGKWHILIKFIVSRGHIWLLSEIKFEGAHLRILQAGRPLRFYRISTTKKKPLNRPNIDHKALHRPNIDHNSSLKRAYLHVSRQKCACLLLLPRRYM